MIFLILMGMGIVFFIVGISFLFKGYLETPDVDTTDVAELENDLKKKQEEEQRLGMELSSTQKELNEARANLQEAKKLEHDIVFLKDKEEYHLENIERLKKKFQDVCDKADIQARGAIDVIESLKDENKSLKAIEDQMKTIDQAKESEEKLKSEMDAVRDELARTKQELEEAQKMKDVSEKSEEDVQKLELDMKTIFQKADSQAQGAVDIINSLQQEKERLLSEKGMLQQKMDEEARKIKEAEENINTLRSENISLQGQVEEGLHKVQQLVQELDQTRDVQQRTAPDSQEGGAEFKDLYNDFRSQVDKMKETVEHIKADGATSADAPQADDSGLQQELKKLKELNSFLADKEKILKLELKKSRVQSLGLKKICEDFKMQIDQMPQRS